MASGAGGEHAVHHVHAHARVLFNLVGIADAHDIARLVLGQMLERERDHLARDLARLADREAADGVAGQVHLDEALGGLAAQVRVHATLNDAEEALVLACELLGPRHLMAMLQPVRL